MEKFSTYCQMLAIATLSLITSQWGFWSTFFPVCVQMVLCPDVFQLFLQKMTHLFLMMFHQQRRVERCLFFYQELNLESINLQYWHFKPIISNKNITHVKTPNGEVSMFLTFYGGTSKMNQFNIVEFGLIELRFLYL